MFTPMNPVFVPAPSGRPKESPQKGLLAASPLDHRFVEAAVLPIQTAPSARKTAISSAFRPSQSLSTSSVCCPSCGAGRMVGVAPL
jgi:hypothetical protein